MAGTAYQSLYELAADQHGYFTSAQAREWGVSTMAVVMMQRRNTVERVSHGVYRLVQFPLSPVGQYMEASFWPGGVRGVISHESALALWQISDVSPAKIHITVPSRFRTHRTPPPYLVLHRSNLTPEEIDVEDGILVTTLERSIKDCHAAHLGGELIRQAIEEGQQTGRLSRATAEALRNELLG